jgi:hypothetical protein
MKCRGGRIAVCAVSAVLLAGCTHSPLGSDGDGAPAEGTIHGVVTLIGGPVTLDGEPALDHAPAKDWRVTIRSDGGSVYRTTTDGAGRYAFVVAPGTYTLDCRRDKRIVVASGETVASHCVVPVP